MISQHTTLLKIPNADRISLRGRPLKSRIADLVRDEILTGRFPLGAQLSEMSIAEELDVSRTPVREALLLLQSEGLVEIIPQSGSYVFSPNQSEIKHVCEMRIILETAAIDLAIKSNDQELLDALEQNVSEAERNIDTDLEKCHRLDTQFHRLLIEASRNPFLIEAYLFISNKLHALRQILPLTETRLSSAAKQHREIIEAVRVGRAGPARNIIKKHIAKVETMLLTRLCDLEEFSKQPPEFKTRRRRSPIKR